MSIANFAIAETSVSDVQKGTGRKTPGKRTMVALADSKTAPEPR